VQRGTEPEERGRGDVARGRGCEDIDTEDPGRFAIVPRMAGTRVKGRAKRARGEATRASTEWGGTSGVGKGERLGGKWGEARAKRVGKAKNEKLKRQRLR
jgi:hypothetical protein